MIYPKNFEQKIGFNTVRQMIKDNCLSPMGEKYVDKIRFNTDFDEILLLLDQVMEFIFMMEEQGSFPEHDYFDMREELSRIRIEGTYISTEGMFDFKTSLVKF